MKFIVYNKINEISIDISKSKNRVIIINKINS